MENPFKLISIGHVNCYCCQIKISAHAFAVGQNPAWGVCLCLVSVQSSTSPYPRLRSTAVAGKSIFGKGWSSVQP